MADPNARKYVAGEVVQFHFTPGIIVASYFVSLIGCITAVELLHRKRGGKAWTGWLYQLGISISFGLVAIWCMHFVGNRAIILGDGRKELQLYYNPGFTALSVILPIVFLFFGFTAVEIRQPGQKFFWPFLIISGFVAGLAITGMHYIGNFGISNYKLSNPYRYIIGACAVAVFASITALSLFFYFKERWINSFPRRIICACLLAGAVSGMHWLASVGTTYILIQENTTVSNTSRDSTLIVAIVLSLLACVVCFAFAFSTQVRKKQLADRAQHVVIASATFDSEGKLLVTQEGLMPSRKVTKQFNNKSFDDEFNVAHPVFQWLYRVTFNWSGVADLVPSMRNHLRSVGFKKESRSVTPVSPDSWEETDNEHDYSLIFREYFCVAAEELAESLDTPLQKLGAMYTEIVPTGTMSNELQIKARRSKKKAGDLETGLSNATMYGKGQLLFLVRRLDKLEASRLIGAGYRFAQPNLVSELIARSMQSPHDEITTIINRLERYSRIIGAQPQTGTALACFAMRAKVKSGSGNWEVLVSSDEACALPQVTLSSEPLKPWQQDILGKLDGLSVNQCLVFLNNTATECSVVAEKEFVEVLFDKITDLTHLVPEAFFGQAIFCNQPVKAPGMAGASEIYSFCIIPDVHQASVKSNKVFYTSLSFFQCVQRVHSSSPDHAILAQRIHREFAALLANKEVNPLPKPRKSTSRATILSPIRLGALHNSSRRQSVASPRHSSSLNTDTQDSGSEKDTTETFFSKVSDTLSVPSQVKGAFGGIMVSSDTTVEVHTKGIDGALEMADMGIKVEAGVAANEGPTYVDELYKIASSRWQGT